MQLILHPMRSDAPLSLTRSGDRLTVNGTELDFAPLPEGALLPREAVACRWIAGDIRREGGMLRIPLILPLGPGAPARARFPAPLTLDRDGPVELPVAITEPAR